MQFKDSGDTPEYEVVQDLTAAAGDVETAVNGLSADGGGDEPEAHNLVFHDSYTTPDDTAQQISWRGASKKIVIVLSDAQPHGDLATQGFAGCGDVEDDPHGLVTSTEIAGMTAAGRTLFMIRQVNSDVSTNLDCYQSLASATGGRAIDHGDSLDSDIIGLILTETPPDRSNSTLTLGDGQPKLVPADGIATTSVTLTLHDASDEPLSLRTFTVAPEAPSGFTKSPARNAYKSVTVSGSLLTDGTGVATFSLSATQPGPVVLAITDDLTNTTLTFPLRIEFTRKVVVLAMGFGSALANRYGYWGGGSGRPFARSTIYGQLNALGYRIEGSPTDPTAFSSADAGATALDVSWDAAPCTPGAASKDCVATIHSTTSDVWWDPPKYDIGGFRRLPSYPKELAIDTWARRLDQTLVTYDQRLASVRGIHASFSVLGHSMGGQLVVRLLGPAAADSYQEARPGLLRSVIALDGAVNWAGAVNVLNEACKSPFYTTADDGRRSENETYVTGAHLVLTTETVMATDTSDRVVRRDVAQLPQDFSAPGYTPLTYKGYGASSKADCAHSVLLHDQSPDTIARLSDSSHVSFPIRQDVLNVERYLGKGV